MKIKLFLAAFCFLLLEGYAQWKPSNGPCAGNVTCLAVSQNTILVGTYNSGVFLSDDNGLSWRMINNGLTNLGVNAVLINGTNFLVGTDGGVFMSTDHGATWSLKGLGGSQVTALAINGSNIFAATYGQGIYISTDNGNSWSEVNNGLTDLYISSLVVNGSTLVAGTIGSGAFVSTNNGYSWTPRGFGNLIYTLMANNGKVYAGTDDGVYVSTDNAATWSFLGLHNEYVHAIAIDGSTLYAGTDGHGIYVSTNNGTSWNAASNGLPDNAEVFSLLITPSGILAGVTSTFGFNTGGVFRSTTQGNAWVAIGLPTSQVYSLVSQGSNIFAGTEYGASFSPDQANSWFYIRQGLPISDPVTAHVYAVATNGSIVLAGTENGVYYSTNAGAQWNATNLTNIDVLSLLIYGNLFFAGTTDGVYISSDNGLTWTLAGLSGHYVYALAAKSNYLFAGTDDGIYLSTTNGASWASSSAGLTTPYVYALAASIDAIYAGTEHGVFVSVDNGSNWQAANNGLPSSIVVKAVAAKDNLVLAGTYQHGVYISLNKGNSWNQANSGLPLDLTILSLCMDNSFAYVGTDGFGVWKRALTEMVGVSDFSQESDILFYPNPVDDYLTISIKSNLNDNMKFFLYNENGKLMLEKTLNEDLITIDVKQFPAGIYFGKLITLQGVMPVKIVKN